MATWEQMCAERRARMEADGFPVGARVRALVPAHPAIPESCRFETGDVGTVILNMAHGPEKVSVVFDGPSRIPHGLDRASLRLVDAHIVRVVAKDEGDFYAITTLSQADLDARASGRVGIPFDPHRVRAHGSLADAQALAREHDAELVVE